MRLPVIIGVILLVAGGLTIAKHLFSLNIPVGRVIFALILIWIGISVIVGPSPHRKHFTGRGIHNNSSFSSSEYSPGKLEDGQSYKVSFGSMKLDLRNADINSGKTQIHAQADFGSMVIIVGKSQALKFHGDVSFGEVKSPSGHYGGIDSKTVYETPGYESAESKIEIFAHCSFGEIKLKQN